MFVDLDADELLVTDLNSSSVCVFARGAGGNTFPLRIVAGAETQLSAASGMVLMGSSATLDPKEIVATNQDHQVTVYAAEAEGNSPPLRSIGGELTRLLQPSGVASTVATGAAAGFVSATDPASIFLDGFESSGLEQWSLFQP